MLFSKENFAASFDVSRETLERMEAYEEILKKWNPKINLVSRDSLADTWHRHFADSAQIWKQIPMSAKIWLDFGSGAGFPALVNAVIAKEKNPSLEFILVESDQRKCAFLISASTVLGLKTRVISSRIEAIPSLKADIITARAVATLDKLLGFSALHAHNSTVLLFPKGISYESELTAAKEHWHIREKVIPSMTDSNSVILKIEEFERAEH